jgi:hypothetical protein
MSICEKTTTLIILDLELVHHFINRKLVTHLASQLNTNQLYTTCVCHWSRPLYYYSSLVMSSQLLLSWPDFCFLSDNYGFLDMGHPLWQEDGSVIYSYNYFWALPEQSLLGQSPAELMTIFYLLSHFRLPRFGGPGPCIYIPQEEGGLVIPLDTVSPLTTRRATAEVF